MAFHPELQDKDRMRVVQHLEQLQEAHLELPVEGVDVTEQGIPLFNSWTISRVPRPFYI